MITAAILNNGYPLMVRSAVNTGRCHETTREIIYEVDTGELITHNPEDGAVALAIKLLKTIKEEP